MIILATIYGLYISLHQGGQVEIASAPSLTRITGGAGEFLSFESVRKEIAKHSISAAEPQIMADGSVAFVSLGGYYSVFDKSYKPLRGLIAKKQFIALIQSDQLKNPIRIVQLPQILKEELGDWLNANYPEFEVAEDSLVLAKTFLRTQAQLPKAKIDISQTPGQKPLPARKADQDQMAIHPLKRISDQDRARKSALQNKEAEERPTLKVYSEKTIRHSISPTIQKDALTAFEKWLQKSNLDLDRQLFQTLEKITVWTDYAQLFRSHTFSELDQVSPTAAKLFSGRLLREYQNFGYSSMDRMRSDLQSTSLQHSVEFTIIVNLQGLGEIPVAFPF